MPAGGDGVGLDGGNVLDLRAGQLGLDGGGGGVHRGGPRRRLRLGRSLPFDHPCISQSARRSGGNHEKEEQEKISTPLGKGALTFLRY